MNRIFGNLIPIEGKSFWYFEIVSDIESDFSVTNECVQWTEERLSENDKVTKRNWNGWYFHDYEEAEKFLVLWRLRWSDS